MQSVRLPMISQKNARQKKKSKNTNAEKEDIKRRNPSRANPVPIQSRKKKLVVRVASLIVTIYLVQGGK